VVRCEATDGGAVGVGVADGNGAPPRLRMVGGLCRRGRRWAVSKLKKE
jgi:hypothetical protein